MTEHPSPLLAFTLNITLYICQNKNSHVISPGQPRWCSGLVASPLAPTGGSDRTVNEKILTIFEIQDFSSPSGLEFCHFCTFCAFLSGGKGFDLQYFVVDMRQHFYSAKRGTRGEELEAMEELEVPAWTDCISLEEETKAQ